MQDNARGDLHATALETARGLSEEAKDEVRAAATCCVITIQPALEPWPRVMIRHGRFAAFLYITWSSWSIGFEVLSGGLALQLGPAMVGAVHVDHFLGEEVRALLKDNTNGNG